MSKVKPSGMFEYDVVVAEDVVELVRLVNERLASNWDLIGGVCAVTSSSGSHRRVGQAVVRLVAVPREGEQ